jgi:hypothetical protein
MLSETPFKILSIESKNGMVLIVRVKIVFDVIDNGNGILTVKPKERVWEILTRKLENLREVLED